MSGASLCSLLGELGYEGWQSLDPGSFEWPFQFEETRLLLDWFCSNLRINNVLSGQEVVQYNELLEDGKVLEGEDLDFAYDSISAFNLRRSSQEAVLGAEEQVKDVKEATLAFNAEALELQNRMQQLQSNFDVLTGQTSFLIQGRRARAAVSSASSEQLLMVEENLTSRNLELNAVLEKISSSTRELANYHSGEEEGVYLSYADFRTFTAQDQTSTKALDAWFVKQFDVGPSRLVAEEGQCKCLWGNLEDGNNLSMKGDAEKTYRTRVAELRRLRSIFGASERQCVEAQLLKSKQQAILAAAESQESVDQYHLQADLSSLRRRHNEAESEIYTLAKSEKKFVNEIIPGLCIELAQLEDTYILQGDYDLKVMRQEYYISQQKKYIGLLADQLARHRFVQVSCHLEGKQMSASYELLRLIETDLQTISHATVGRIERCTDLGSSTADTQERGAVHDEDIFVHRLRDILHIHAHDQGGSRMYVSMLGLVQKVSQLLSEKLFLQAEVNHTVSEDKRKCLSDLCDVIRQMQQLLFSSSTTAQPVLSPWPLMKEVAEMEKVNSQLSAGIEEVTHEHREKAEIVKHHPHEVGRERQVFVDFFLNPDRLRNLVRELSSRVKAFNHPLPPSRVVKQ